jgi:hypothetical protein
MHKKILMLLLFIFWAVPAWGQMIVDTAWVRRYNGPANSSDEACAIAVDESSHVYVTGASTAEGSSIGYATIKYYPNGDTAWVRRYDGLESYNTGASAIAVDVVGNVYVTGGMAGDDTSTDYTTIKYYPQGEVAWIRKYNGPPGHGHDQATAIAIDTSGNVYVTGYSEGIGTNGDYATVKYYPNGDTAWVRRYDGPVSLGDQGNAITVDDSGYVYVTGSSYGGTITGRNYLTIKYYPHGDTVWVRRYIGPGHLLDEPVGIAVDDSGNVYVAGYSAQLDHYPDNYDYATIKYSPQGDIAWVRNYHGGPIGDGDDIAQALTLDKWGNIYVTGYSLGTGWRDDYVTVKYYPNGDVAWVKRYNGLADRTDRAKSIAVDSYGNVYVAGYSLKIDTQFDYVTLKYDSLGNQIWVARYNGSGNADDYAYAIATDAFGNVYVTGASPDSQTQDDYATVKYVETGIWRGDANHDGLINSADVSYLINYLFISGPPPDFLEAGDPNCDGVINSVDVSYLINYLFVSGPPPSC